jgi:ATP-dependent Lhr-like helicase
VPVLLEIGKEQVYGSGLDALLDEGAQALIEEATASMEIGQGQAELPL